VLAGKRSVRVGDQLLKVAADLLLRKVNDPRVKGANLTGIQLSRDLKHARIFFSVIGNEQDARQVQKGLDSAKGFIKRELGIRMDLKYIPEVVFKHDPSLEEGDKMEKLFEKLKSGITDQEK